MQNKTKKEVIFESLNRSIPIALVVLAVLAVLYTLYFSKSILVPIFVAAFAALFLSPMVRLLSILKIPKSIGAALVIFGMVSVIYLLLSTLVEPASRWLEKVPIISDKLAFQLEDSSKPLGALKDSVMPEGGDQTVQIQEAMDSTVVSLVSILAETTVMFIFQVLTAIIIAYFFLVFGEDLMRNFVKAQESFSDKKLTVVMFQTIRDDISRYVLVISIINIGLGVITAALFYYLGLKDALLWGALATLLNFAPYVGPTLLTIILAAVGFIEYDSFAEMIVVPGIFLILNLIECQFITPTLLGKRFNTNPLLIILWMFAWGWLWGPVGMLIAIPLIMCFKILAKHTGFIGDWVQVLEGQNSEPSNAA